MPVIEGTYGPLITDQGAPEEGTDAVQTLTIGGTPDGGTFRLGFGGAQTDDIDWSATDATLVAHVNAALNGTAEVQTLTFAGINGGTFRLRYRNQLTDKITWSSTNNTLRDRVDNALEALPNIGTGGVTTAVGSMTSGIGTLTVTFAKKGVQPAIEVANNKLTGTAPSLTVARTTPGTGFAPLAGDVTVAEDSLTSGVGTISITFDGATWTKRVVPLITVEDNSLTGTSPTVAVTEDTAGVTAFGRGLQPGGSVIDTSGPDIYLNQGTGNAPDYKAVTTS